MKKTILNFALFYLTLPTFALAIMVAYGFVFSHADSMAYISEEISEKEVSPLIEKALFGQESIDELILSIPEGTYPIVSKTIRSQDNILNETSYVLDENEIISHLPEYEPTGNFPLVLVVHTHGTECYLHNEKSLPFSSDYQAYYNEAETKTRTQDVTKNVVAVGEVFCKALENEGIGVIHCTEMFDRDDYNSAYSKSGKAIEKYLKEYPSIKLVIDLHRDSLVSADKIKIKTSASDISDGCAQVMLVVGSDAGGSPNPGWKRNLALGLQIKEVMDKSYPSLARPIFFRGARYNQHLPYSSFLLEVGSCGNTLEEAKTAAILSAKCVASVILSR